MSRKLISFLHHGHLSWGILSPDEQGVYSASQLEETFFISLPENILALIESGREGLLELASIFAQLDNPAIAETTPLIPLRDIELMIPFIPPHNVFCVGKNYLNHITEFEQKADPTIPSSPIYFTKSAACMVATEQPIPLHNSITQKVDYEGELAVIIGHHCDHVAEKDASDYIFGYTILNDVTARDLQQERGQWFYGKNLTGFCPIGPSVLLGVHAEPFCITTLVNGEKRQQATTDDLIFSIPHIISDLSKVIALSPGDIIATGTPAGVGMGMNPPQFLKTGDIVEITISDIGTLRNKVQ